MAETGLNYDLLRLTLPAPTIRSQSAKDFLEGSQAIRDARRKKAIEEAMRKGVDPKGEWNEQALRQSLADAGFGEDAESVVRSITSPRAEDVSKITTLGMELKNLVDAGIVSRERAEELMGNTSQITRTPVSQSSDTAWMEGIPSSQATPQAEYASTGTEDGTVRITTQPEQMNPLYEQTSSSKKAQAVPQFAANLIDFSKKFDETTLGDVSASPGGVITYTLPAGDDGKFVLAGAHTLGYTAQDSASLDAEIKERARAMVPQPVFAPKGRDAKSWMEAQAEYKKAVAEYPAKYAQQQALLIKELEAAQAARFGQKATKIAQAVTRAQERRAERAQRVSLNPLDPTTNPALTREVTPAEYAVALQGSAGLRDMETAYQRYMENPSLANLVAFQIGKKKASGEPITQDAIASGILESGAVPKEQELLLKGAIQSTNVKDLLLGKGLDMTGISFNPQAASKEYFEEQLLNQVGDIQDRGRKATAKDWLGGKKGDTKPPVAAPQTPPAKPSRRKASAEDF